MKSKNLEWNDILATAEKFSGILLTSMDDATKFYVGVEGGSAFVFPMPGKDPKKLGETDQEALRKFNRTGSMDSKDYSKRGYKPGYVLRLIELALSSA